MKKLTVKDVIYAAAFTALLIVVIFAIGMTGYIPIMMVFLAPLLGFCTAPIYMLYFSKIEKFGMLTITGVIFALIFGMSGHGVFAIPFNLCAFLLAEFILYRGDYKSIKHAQIATVVCNLNYLGNFLPIMLNRNSYYDSLISQGYGAEYANAFMSLMSNEVIIISIIAGFIAAYIGTIISKKIMKKHFVKANMI